MKHNLRNLSRADRWLALCCIAAVVAVLTYNIWMVCCGSCTVNNLITIPWLSWLLIFGNVACGLLLITLKRRHAESGMNACPRCALALKADWRYCPSCGRDRPRVA